LQQNGAMSISKMCTFVSCLLILLSSSPTNPVLTSLVFLFFLLFTAGFKTLGRWRRRQQELRASNGEGALPCEDKVLAFISVQPFVFPYAFCFVILLNFHLASRTFFVVVLLLVFFFSFFVVYFLPSCAPPYS